MGLKEKKAKTRKEYKVGRQVDKVGKKITRKRNDAQKIGKFKNTTKAT